MQLQHIAVIDLGANTARVVVISAIPGHAYRLEDEIREVVRLHQGMTAGGLSEESMARALFTLRLFKRFCDSYGVDLIIPSATSAVRKASNGTLFVERVKRELGLSLRVLSGEREAYFATLGALNEVSMINGFVVDIGGGSAQISDVRERRFTRGISLPLGALALSEEFVKGDPIRRAERQTLQKHIDEQLDRVPWLQDRRLEQGQVLVGVGGTIRNLARMESARSDYPLNTLHGFMLDHESINDSIRQLGELPLAKRQKLPGLQSDRADIILPGAMVIQTIMERLQAEQLTISVNGLREGLFFNYFWKHLHYPVVADVRGFSILNMARTYRYQKNHANHVRFLADRLFNQLAPLHGYDTVERGLLDAAALLHDLGSIIGYDEHHKHTQTLISNSGLPGYTPRETAIISLLTRYHRKGKPKIKRFGQLLGVDDRRLVTRMAAILRLAEYLERGRNANVDDVIVTWNEQTLHLTLIADEYPAVELWEAERNALPLVELAFGRRVVLESTAAAEFG
jgi:exopolyphosphatase/guanosine-5'-triphosphate,3'-diphosphate pyrophosphatase